MAQPKPTPEPVVVPEALKPLVEQLAKLQPGDRDLVVRAAESSRKTTDEQLFRAARTPVQKTEAKFYTAMLRRAKGSTETKKELAEVASSEAIELVEVMIARDLLAREAPLPMKLPDGVAVP